MALEQKKTKAVVAKQKEKLEAISAGENPFDHVSSKINHLQNHDQSLANYVTKLLQSPVAEKDQEILRKAGFCESEMNQALLLAQTFLSRAVEKGDVSAFKEIKSILQEEEDGDGLFQEIMQGICESVQMEKSGVRKRGPK